MAFPELFPWGDGVPFLKRDIALTAEEVFQYLLLREELHYEIGEEHTLESQPFAASSRWNASVPWLREKEQRKVFPMQCCREFPSLVAEACLCWPHFLVAVNKQKKQRKMFPMKCFRESILSGRGVSVLTPLSNCNGWAERTKESVSNEMLQRVSILSGRGVSVLTPLISCNAWVSLITTAWPNVFMFLQALSICRKNKGMCCSEMLQRVSILGGRVVSVVRPCSS